MHAETYQRLAARTLIDEPDSRFTSNEIAVMIEALDLAAKVGDVMEYIKKGICHRHGFDVAELDGLLHKVREQAIDTRIAYNVPLNVSVPIERQMLVWCALGLCGEAGEIAEIINGAQWDDFDSTPLVKELGDSQWYAAALCTLIGVSLSDVMAANIAKLEQRYPNGYLSKDSKARVDV
jgi:NTP pyrophosphatase (non-canonical NTP hydrolase)